MREKKITKKEGPCKKKRKHGVLLGKRVPYSEKWVKKNGGQVGGGYGKVERDTPTP